MQRLRQMLADIGKYLGGLPLAARLLFVALALVVVLAMLFVATRAASPAMVELYGGAAPVEDQIKARDALSSAGIAHKMVNGRLMVLPDDRAKALAAAVQAGAGPKNTQLMFATLAGSQSWMNSRDTNRQNADIALMNELAMIIRNFNGVEDARVVIDVPEPVGMGMAYRKPTGAVSVTLRPGRALTQNMVDSIAALVSGAKAGLDIRNVKVVDTNNPGQRTARAEEDVSAGDYMEHVAKIESRTQEKVQGALGYIRGVLVAVSAQVDARRVAQEIDTKLPVGQGSVAIREKENTTERTTAMAGPPGEENGVRANVGASAAAGGGQGGSRTSDTTSDTGFVVGIGSRREKIIDPRGMPTRVTAMVSLPREYITELVRQAKGQPEAEVTQAEIEAKFAEEKTRLERELEPLVATTAVQQAGGGAEAGGGAAPDPAAAAAAARSVVVSLIPVPMAGSMAGGGLATSAQAGLGGAGGGLLGDLGGSGLVKTAVVGVLTLAALGMVLMLTRRSTQPTDLPKPEQIVGLPPALEAADDLVGEADEGQAAMEGIELEEGELKTKKMLEQVEEMVKKSPSDAAALLNRWVQVAE